jgi:hypothetical protein
MVPRKPLNKNQQAVEVQETPQKRAHGGQIHNKNAAVHGHYGRKVALKGVDCSEIESAFDQRTKLGRFIFEKAHAIYKDGGGREQFSELKRDLTGHYVITDLLLQQLNVYLLDQPSLVNKRKKTVLPILLERNRLIETLMKLASAIGIERTPTPVLSLQEYLAGKEEEMDNSNDE